MISILHLTVIPHKKFRSVFLDIPRLLLQYGILGNFAYAGSILCIRRNLNFLRNYRHVYYRRVVLTGQTSYQKLIESGIPKGCF